MKLKYTWDEDLGVLVNGYQWLQLTRNCTKKFRTIAGKLLVKSLNKAQPYRLP